jgi:hypothetical protein
MPRKKRTDPPKQMKEPDRAECIKRLRKYYEKVDMILSHHPGILARNTNCLVVDKIIDNTRLGKPPTYGKGFAKDREEYINLTKEMS